MLGNEKAWARHHGGSCYDVMLTLSYEVIPVNLDYFQTMEHENISKYLLVPTRQSTVTMLALNHFLSCGMPVHVIGSKQTGKTSLKHMLTKRTDLSALNCVEEWGESLKKRLTYVRRDGADWLVHLN